MLSFFPLFLLFYGMGWLLTILAMVAWLLLSTFILIILEKNGYKILFFAIWILIAFLLQSFFLIGFDISCNYLKCWSQNNMYAVYLPFFVVFYSIALVFYSQFIWIRGLWGEEGK